MEKNLPAIPDKRYFTIGEVSDLCGVKPYVLRYWEQEFAQLKPMKRRGNRRYYQHHEVLLIRRIRKLLYEQGFTISGARNRLSDPSNDGASESSSAEYDNLPSLIQGDLPVEAVAALAVTKNVSLATAIPTLSIQCEPLTQAQLRDELKSIRELLVWDSSRF
jgi:DNA-binding transcriptional MerR regulator